MEFICGIEKYFELYDKGLKKQANIYIKDYVSNFERSVPENERDEIIFSFCREMLDEEKYKKFTQRGNGSLPYELNKLLWNYLKHQCELEKMPQMRWTFQLFGKNYNPFDPNREIINPYKILERAYNHKDCDNQTVDLYFSEQLEWLEWGAHHFPNGCIITKESYDKAVETAEKIIFENYVSPELKKRLVNMKKLYQCFYDFKKNGGDFYKICEDSGIGFLTNYPPYFYKKI